MDTSVLLALKIAASTGIGLLLGMEREFAHKEAGARTFAIAALLGTLSWLLSSTLALVQCTLIVLVALIMNGHAFWKTGQTQITTSLALAAANILGMTVGAGDFFLSFAGAIAIAALLSWKTELITLSGKLTEREIRGALLLAFISFVVYPLLPVQPIDPWHILNLRAVWLTVIAVSALKFVNYVLLRIFGERGLRYSALLGGLVNSAAMALFLGEETLENEQAARDAPGYLLLADTAMILRNWVLVFLFSAPRGLPGSLLTLFILVPMTLVAGLTAGLTARYSHQASGQQEEGEQMHKQEAHTGVEASSQAAVSRQETQAHKSTRLTSPLSLGSVCTFALVFLTLTVLSGTGRLLFGATGFLAVIVVGALASAASSAALLGSQLATGLLAANPAAVAMLLATIAGLVENVGIFWFVTRKPAASWRLLLLTLPAIASGTLLLFLLPLFH